MNRKFNPKVRSLENQSIATIIQQIVQGYPLESKLNQVRIEEIWVEAMGSGVSNYTQSIYLKRDTLFIKLSSAVLRDELSYGKSKIISMLNQALGSNVIKELKLL